MGSIDMLIAETDFFHCRQRVLLKQKNGFCNKINVKAYLPL